MARLNILKLSHLVPPPAKSAEPRTHEGAPAVPLAPREALRRTVLTALLWEDECYESGETIAARVRALVPLLEPAEVAALAVEAREQMHLRHLPLLLVREMARCGPHRQLVAATLARVIQRADELAEFVALYWKDGKQPLSGQVKKGLAAAFPKFDAYALAKYDRAAPVRLRDVLFLCHAKPVDAVQAQLWGQLIAGALPAPETWEVRISGAGRDAEAKRTAWEALLRERRVGALALLRNLRNLDQAGVEPELVREALAAIRAERVLPFRFLAAARHAPGWEPELEQVMFRSVAGRERLNGRTALLVDVSGSMAEPLARRSEMLRMDAACGLAILLREVAEQVDVWSFSDRLALVSPRRGFALRDAIAASQPHQGTQLGRALAELPGGNYDRLVVITDEQSQDRVPPPRERGYMINVASARNGVGYGTWTHIDGWSEAVVGYMGALEREQAGNTPGGDE